MRLFGTLRNELKKINEGIYLTFKIQTSFSPSNLWVVYYADSDQTVEFLYRKVLSVMYATSEYKNNIFHCKIITYADGNEGMKELLVRSVCDDANYLFDQFGEINYTYFIDLDELKTNKEFSGLSTIDCFHKLEKIYREKSNYQNLFNLFSYSNKLCTVKEHLESLD